MDPFYNLVTSMFNWLPFSLRIPVYAIIGVAMLVVLIKFIGIILDPVYKFIDIIIPL